MDFFSPHPHETVVLNVQICYNVEMITKKASTWVNWGLLILKQGKSSPFLLQHLGVMEKWMQL